MKLIWHIIIAVVIGNMILCAALHFANLERKDTVTEAYRQLLKNPTAAGKK